MLQELGSCDSKGLADAGLAWRSGASNVHFDATQVKPWAVGTTAPFGGRAKRALDLTVSLLLLPLVVVVGFPIGCLVALGGGRVIYGHARIGWNGRLFRCYKFRTMKIEAENELQAILDSDCIARQQWQDRFKLENDPRVTPWGRWLRKTHLDELPQIWNVLRGDMSWVGPRPIVADEAGKYGVFLSAYLACRPGVCGLWQLRRRSDTSYTERVAMDVEYARKWSAARDIMILLLTIPRILSAAQDG